MNLFYSEILAGPTTDDEFVRTYEEAIEPRLSTEGVDSEPWLQDRPSRIYVVHGTATFDPAELLSNVFDDVAWKADTRLCAALVGFPSSSATVATCAMPNNPPEAISHWRQKTCPNGHVFDRRHHIDYCVICPPGTLLT